MDHHEYSRILEALFTTLRILVVHLIFVANVAHFDWTLKKTQKSRQTWLLKLAFVLFVPTYPVAEAIFSLFGTLSLILRMQPEQLKWPANAAGWKRYICSSFGVYVTADPETRRDDEDAEDAAPLNPLSKAPAPVKLNQVQYDSDLRYHQKPWDATTVLRIIIPFLGALVPIIFAVLPFPGFNTEQGLYCDMRYFITITANGICTVLASIVILCRAEWSMVHLTTSQPREQKPFFQFTFVLMLAACLYELPYVAAYRWWQFTGTFFIVVFNFWWFILFFLAPMAFVSYILRDKIVERAPINWWLIFATILLLFNIWIGVDMIIFLICDVTA